MRFRALSNREGGNAVGANLWVLLVVLSAVASCAYSEGSKNHQRPMTQAERYSGNGESSPPGTEPGGPEVSPGGSGTVGGGRDDGRWLSSGKTCHGQDVYQGDVVMDTWAYAYRGSLQVTPVQPNVARGRRQTLAARDRRRRYYTTKKASRVETDRRTRRELQNMRSPRVRRGATVLAERLWPGGVIPFEIDIKFQDETKNLLMQSMRHWEDYTCLQFIPRTNQTAYVFFFFAVDGCCSFVGRAGGKQVVYLGPGCDTFNTIIHELGHVIGFWHEHSRPDRDDYVTIRGGNVWPGDLYNFNRLGHRVIDSLDQPYDYDSVMHYGRRSFSRNRNDTIIPKDDWPIGGGTGLSVGDILQANLLYRCTVSGECGGTIFKNRGQLTSPHYPEPFVPNTTCDWSIAVEEGQAVKLVFVDVDLPISQDGGDCPRGYVEVRDGRGELGRLIGTYCGSTPPAPITLDSGRAWLRFSAGRSAEFQSRAGFAVKFQSVSVDERLRTASSGVVKSSNYPAPVPANTDSVWQIVVKKGFVVSLRIYELLISVSAETGCYSDYMIIIDGDTSQSPVITKLCQSQQNVGAVSAGASLRIVLHTGNSEGRGDGDPDRPTRLHAAYTQRDANECQTNNGGCEQACLNVIGSFVCGCQYGYTLERNYRNCTDIDECLDNNGGCSDLCVNTEGAYHCACSEGLYLSANNNTYCFDENECDDTAQNGCDQHCYNTIGSYACACNPGFILAPNGKSCFVLDNCGGIYAGSEGTFSSPELPPNNFNNTLDCTWRIEVDPAFAISVRIALLEWAQNDLCHDYLDFAEGESLGSNQVTICNHDDLQEVYHTEADVVWVHYRSVWPHEGAFRVEYFTRERDNNGVECGGVLNAGTGILQSPGYPHAYPNGVRCVWKITGRIITLHFETFDLEQGARCSFDYLDIQDGDASEPQSRHVGRFCGKELPPNELTSTTGEVFIEFQTDATVQAAGFRALFEVQSPRPQTRR